MVHVQTALKYVCSWKLQDILNHPSSCVPMLLLRQGLSLAWNSPASPESYLSLRLSGLRFQALFTVPGLFFLT